MDASERPLQRKIYVVHTVELSTEQHRPGFAYFSDLSSCGDYRNRITLQCIAETAIVITEPAVDAEQ
ncbi:hypothetical protein NDU88_002100 [Pleurodeles waltl]|uniref:Uncharacterized protein n=1 Tax=Pleurodeles waltl TaxID=8319 RepID=A0AAV7Q8X4_PLEWA|nr:hypothetical protein NDU88_002100 [Pleurodeles waltl]